MLAQAGWTGAGMAGDYLAACLGGVAPADQPALADACKATLAEVTRKGIVFNIFIYLWAAAHYALAAITLPRDLARVRAKK